MYRSKDSEFMESLKKSVLRVTKEQDQEDRKFGLDYLRTHVRIDDLRKLILKKFPNRIIDLGQGSLSPKVVIVTKDPIGKEEKKKLDQALARLGVADLDVYYAHLRFVKTKKKQDIRLDLFQKLINMLAPKVVIVFDKVSISVKSEVCETGCAISVLTNAEKKEQRRKITRILKNEIKQKVVS